MYSDIHHSAAEMSSSSAAAAAAAAAGAATGPAAKAVPQKGRADADLGRYLDKRVRVRMNAGRTVTGRLIGYDKLMNVLLDAAVEGSAAHAPELGKVVRDWLGCSLSVFFFLSLCEIGCDCVCSLVCAGDSWKQHRAVGVPGPDSAGQPVNALPRAFFSCGTEE